MQQIIFRLLKKSLSGHSHTCICFIQCMSADGSAPQRPLSREARFKRKRSCPEGTGPCSIPPSGIRNLISFEVSQQHRQNCLGSHQIWAENSEAKILSLPGVVKRTHFGGSTRRLWLSTSATTRESKRQCLLLRKQLQLHLQSASFIIFKPSLYLPGQVKGSVWPYRALGEHREQWTGVSTSLRQPAHPGPSPTLQSLCLELAPWWSYTSADVPKVEVKFVFKNLKKMQKAVVVMAIFGCLFSSFFFFWC